MKAIKISEAIQDLFPAKKEEDIINQLERTIGLNNDVEEATKHLRAAILRANLPYAKYALNNGAKVIEDENNVNSSGNMWIAFNDNNEASEDIIIEMLKHSENRFKLVNQFKEQILAKTIFMAYFKVLDWIFGNFEKYVSKQNIVNSLEMLYSDYGGGGHVRNGKNTEEAVEFLEKKLNEEISNIFKPRNETSILADILETDEKNIPTILKMYKNWKKIISKNTKTVNEDNEKIIKLFQDLKTYNYPDEKSAAILGLNRMYDSWKQKRTSNLILLSNCIDWVHWVEDNLNLFKHRVGHVYKELKESVLIPKSNDEIQNILENLSYEEYKKLVLKAVYEYYDNMPISGEPSFLSASDTFGDIIQKGFEEHQLPKNIAIKILKEHYKNVWEPNAYYSLGEPIEIKIDNSGDSLEFRFGDDDIPKWAEIKFDEEGLAYFEYNSRSYHLENFMRI